MKKTTVDLGIDAHFELVQENPATGKLIAAQVKTGRRYVSDVTPGVSPDVRGELRSRVTAMSSESRVG